MHYFSGSKQHGWWYYEPTHPLAKGCEEDQVIEVVELNDHPNIEWQVTPDSGDFFWPHYREADGKLIALDYRSAL